MEEVGTGVVQHGGLSVLKKEYGREYVWRVEFSDTLVRGVDVGWDISVEQKE